MVWRAAAVRAGRQADVAARVGVRACGKQPGRGDVLVGAADAAASDAEWVDGPWGDCSVGVGGVRRGFSECVAGGGWKGGAGLRGGGRDGS